MLLHVNTIIKPKTNVLISEQLTLPKEPWPSTLQSSNCRVSAFSEPSLTRWVMLISLTEPSSYEGDIRCMRMLVSSTKHAIQHQTSIHRTRLFFCPFKNSHHSSVTLKKKSIQKTIVKTHHHFNTSCPINSESQANTHTHTMRVDVKVKPG